MAGRPARGLEAKLRRVEEKIAQLPANLKGQFEVEVAEIRGQANNPPPEGVVGLVLNLVNVFSGADRTERRVDQLLSGAGRPTESPWENTRRLVQEVGRKNRDESIGTDRKQNAEALLTFGLADAEGVAEGNRWEREFRERLKYSAEQAQEVLGATQQRANSETREPEEVVSEEVLAGVAEVGRRLPDGDVRERVELVLGEIEDQRQYPGLLSEDQVEVWISTLRQAARQVRDEGVRRELYARVARLNQELERTLTRREARRVLERRGFEQEMLVVQQLSERADDPEAVRQFGARAFNGRPEGNLTLYLTRDEIVKLHERPALFFQEILDLAHGDAVGAKSAERGTYFQKLSTGFVLLAEYYRKGEHAFSGLNSDERRTLYMEIARMYKAGVGLISALGPGGVQQVPDKRLEAIPYFTPQEVGWIHRQWWQKLATLKLIGHGDLVMKLLYDGERPNEVERYLDIAKEDANLWLRKWIEDFDAEGPGSEVAEQFLMELFANAVDQKGEFLRSYCEDGRVRNKGAFLDGVRYITYDFDSREFVGLTRANVHRAYDFLRWEGVFAELDARYVDRDAHGHADGFLYKPYIPQDMRVKCAYKEGKLEELFRLHPKDRAYYDKWIRDTSRQLRKHESDVAYEHFTKVHERGRRGDWEAGMRGLMDPAFNFERKGWENLGTVEMFTDLVRWRSLPTFYFFGLFAKDERGRFKNFDDLHKATGLTREQAERVYSRMIDPRDPTYMRPFGPDYVRGARVTDYSTVRLDEKLGDRGFAEDQLLALKAMRAFEGIDGGKSSWIADWLNDGAGVAQYMHEVLEPYIEDPYGAGEEALHKKLNRTTLISESFGFPRYYKPGFLEKIFFTKVLGEPLVKDMNKENKMLMLKKHFKAHPATVAQQKVLLKNLTQSFYVDIPHDAPFLSLDVWKKKIQNQLTWWRFQWYVIGPEKLLTDSFGRAGTFLWYLLKAFFTESTKGTELEGAVSGK